MLDIVAALEDEVAQLPPGARLPSEHELMGRFNATRSTVRRAIEQLENRYLLRRVHGSGTFVNRRIDYLLSPGLAPSLHDTVQRAGAEARTFVLDAGIHDAPADIAAHLDVPAGESCMRLVRVGYIDDQPAMCGEEWIRPGILDHVDVSLRAIESLTEVLRGSHRDPTRAWSRASTELPPALVVQRLELRAPAPVWCLETLTRDGVGGAPLMFSRSWMRQDRIRVVIEFDGRDAAASTAH
ncbi:GntR family transcriptional regulator [Microbacterium sp. A93]|uniref:GntR family transcriptional regulator n=1 Tax=Microbacterium sp. A93 TaxID=3450716 RepID=UPI003F42DF14